MTAVIRDQAIAGRLFCPSCGDYRPVYRAGSQGTVKTGSICCSHCQRLIQEPKEE